MKKAKKFLTVLLCAAMLIMSVPTTALAEAEEATTPAETVVADETTSVSDETLAADESTAAPEETTVADETEPASVDVMPLAVADTDVAQIGDTGYATFEEALAAAADGETIELLADVTLAASTTVSKNITLQPAEGKTVTIHRGGNYRSILFTVNKSLTLNGNGGNLILDGQMPAEATARTAYGPMIKCTGTLVMNDGVTLQNNINDSSNHGGAIYVEGGSFTMNGGLITNCGETSKSNLTAYNTSGGGAIRLQGASGRDTTAVMNGGTISDCFGYNGGAVCVTNYYTKNVTFTMNGGRITGCVAGMKLAEKDGARTGEGAAFYTFNKVKTTAYDTVVTINGGEIDHNYAYECGALGMNKTTANSGGMYYVLGGYIHDNDIRQSEKADTAFDSPGKWYGNSIFTQGNSSVDGVPLVTIGGDVVIQGEIYLKAGAIALRDDFTGKADLYHGTYNAPMGTLVAKAVATDGSASTATAAVAGKLGITNALFNAEGGFDYDEDGNIVRKYSTIVDPVNENQYILGDYTAPVPQYTVTYTDGVEEEEVFADQSYTVAKGEATPAFEGTPERKGYTFTGWDKEIAATVTEDVTYTATWELEKVYVAMIESTGEQFETLQSALDAVKKLIENDTIHAAQTVTLLADTTESVKLTWVKGLYIDYNFDLTIDLAGHTVTGNGDSVMQLGSSGKGGAGYAAHFIIEDSSEAKTGTITGGTASSGGAIKFTGNVSADTLTINGGNFVNNTATSGGGAIYQNMVGVKVIINRGTFTGNTAQSGGAIYSPAIVVNGGVMTGNKAVGSANFTGRGGAICAWAATPQVEINGGQIYGNTAESFGDDIVWGNSSKSGINNSYLRMISAENMNVDDVTAWFMDGDPQVYNTNRYSKDNAEEFTEYENYKVQGIANARGLKAAAKYYTVVYTDGVEEEEVFADQSYTVAKGETTPAFEGTPERKGYSFTGWTPEVTETVTEDITYTATWAAPAVPDKFGKNVTPELVRVICDSDADHAPIDVPWQFQSTKVYPGATPVWDTELDTWTLKVRIDSVSVYYVWAKFEKVYNNIVHTMVDETQKCIDTYLKWDEEKELWVTLDEKPIEVHVTCKTQPDAPTIENAGIYQINVEDVGGLVNTYYFKMKDYPATFTIGEVTGNREDGFECVITVTIEEDDAYITNWMDMRGVEGYHYDWDKTPETITYTLKYMKDCSTTLYGTSYGDWALAKNGSTYGHVGTVYARKDVTVTYTDGVDEDELFVDQTYTVAKGEATPEFDGTPERTGYTFTGWTPEVAEIVTEDVTYAATWKINKYTVTFDANGGAAIDPVVADYGTRVKFPSSPLDGFTQSGWQLVGTDTVYTGKNVLVESDMTLMVQRAIRTPDVKITMDNTIYHWVAEPRTLTAEVKEYAGLVYEYQWYKDGTAIDGANEKTLTIVGNVSDSGEYKLVVTVTKEDGSPVVTTNEEAVGEGVYKVAISKVANTLRLNWNDGSEKPETYDSYTNGNDITISKKATRTGYTFLGWNTEADGSGTMYQAGEKYPFADPTDNNGNGGQLDNLYAQWKLNQYTVTFDANGGAPIAPVVADYGTRVKFPSSPLDGFTQSGWQLVGTDTVYTGKNVLVESDMTLMVQRAIRTPDVKITMDNTIYHWVAEPRTLTAEVKEYAGLVYEYQWYKDGEAIEGANEKTLTIVGNVSDSGEYKLVVTVTKEDGSTVVTTNEEAVGEGVYKVAISKVANTLRLNWNDGSEKPETYDSYTNGNDITISKRATRTGYTFLGWNTEADGSGTMYQAGEKYPFADPTDNNGNGGQLDNLYAQWKANKYTVSFDSNGGSKVPSVTVTYDDPMGKLPSTSREGYEFLGWYDADGNKVSASTVYTVAGDSKLTARWRELTDDEKYAGWTFGLYFDSKGGTSFDPITVTYGKAIGMLPTPVMDGYKFIGWMNEDGQIITADTVYKLHRDSTVVAQWTKGTTNSGTNNGAGSNNGNVSSPQTGDTSPVMLLGLVMLISALAAAVFGKKRLMNK